MYENNTMEEGDFKQNTLFRVYADHSSTKIILDNDFYIQSLSILDI